MSTALQDAKKKRAAAKCWIKRTAKNIEDLLNDDATSLELLEDTLYAFDQKLADLGNHQTAVELELDSDEMEADIDEAEKFVESARKVRAKATKRMKEMNVVSDSISVSSKDRSEVKLPSLELPKYAGEAIEWQPFWDRFEALVDQSDLPVISKFSYLQSLLRGEALSVIQGLALTSANYKIACDLLKERFGSTERIVFAHVSGLMNASLTSRAKGANHNDSLWKLRDQLLRHIRSLEALGIGGDQYGLVLTPIIVARLPQDIRLEWSRESAGREGDLDWLMKFLQTEIQRRERAEIFKDLSMEKSNVSQDFERRKVSSASALQTSAEEGPQQCVFCQKRHKSEKCNQMLRLDATKREEKVRSLGLCFKCLAKGHTSRDCRGKVKCTQCNGFHNVLFCRTGKSICVTNNSPGTQGVTHTPNEQVKEAVNAGSGTVEHVGISHDQRVKRSTVLQTAKIKTLTHDGKTIDTVVMFDLGADTTYVSRDIVRRIKPKWVTSKYTSYSSFGDRKSQNGKERNVYDVKVIDAQGNPHSLLAVEVDHICPPLSRQRIPSDVLQSLSHLQLADEYQHDRDLTLDILVGVDNYWRFVSTENLIRCDDLVAFESVFGWILSGSCMKTQEENVSHQMLCMSTVKPVNESELHEFWSLESIGICAGKDKTPKDPVLDNFEKSIKFVDGRYEVALPWKSDVSKMSLLDNEVGARKRLATLNSKFEKNPSLRIEYDKVLQSYEDSNIIEEVPQSEMGGPYPIYYMPHRPVIKECVSTKIRPVFDASAVGPNGVSLNDCLESGPSLIPDLVEILLRFRRRRIGLSADITKAFLQIGVQRSDQDVHRFLWQNGQSIRVMRFVRVPFGNTCSPFLLNATLRHHLNSYPVSVTVQELQENLYVDDWLSGADTVEEANTMFREAQSILSDAGMTLSKWNSNSESLTHQFNQFFEVGETTKLLGMHWNASKDVFSFKGLNLDCNFDLNFTKRNVLSLIARLFDPLGLISPFTMYAKILFQEVWRLGFGWDEILSHDLQLKCQQWIDGIQSIKTFEIPRCYYPDSSLSSVVGLEVHAFSDASEKGYGSCVYLRIPKSDTEFHVSFVMARTKVAPIKRVTLPRLELLGALLSARLSHFVKSALHLSDCVRLVYWTDSKVALSWIKGNPNKWKLFVANRVTEIQTLTSPSDWFHCPGTDNPADLMTRGLLADQLISNNMWLRGPNWLASSSCFSARSNVEDEIHNLAHTCEESKGGGTALTVNEKATSVFDFSRYSEFSKVMNIIAWVKRFIINCKPDGTKHSGPLTYEELIKAKDSILICVQKESYEKERSALSQGKPLPRNSSLIKHDPFLDSNGLLRVKGRLQYSDLSYDSKHPIIIPNCHVAKLMVQFHHKLLKHAGVHTLMSSIRNSYWIIGLRQVAKKVCRECVACKRFDSRPCSQSTPPLPELRVKSTFPFAVAGLDYAGPLFAVDQLSQKLYFLLFTCAVTRSVHLELTDSLSVPDCLLALRRFTARRGLPSVVYSDNAKTFKSVANALQQYFSVLSPKWKFIAPRSPWWGGWWERLVRSVKSALKKCLGTRCLTKCELETTLFEVEACINSRPLTYVSDDHDVKNPLTPSHFLIGRVAGFQPHVSDEHLDVSHRNLNERELVRERQLDKFWKVWSDDYLRNLPPTVKGSKPNCNLKKGSVILLREDNVPRMSWPLGVIIELLPGRDGIVRCVNVRTAKGVLCRPVQKLHDLEICFETNGANEDIENPLECSKPDEEEVARDEDVETIEQVKTSRSGRVVKPRVMLDL